MRHIALLRGVNLGSRNRVSMPELRAELGRAGFDGVRTYVASGNILLDSDAPPEAVAARCSALIAKRFALTIPVLVRTRAELADVVAANPLRDVAEDPKRYQVSFLSEPLHPDVMAALEAVRAEPERLVAHGRELYAWHPEGVARSKLWAQLGGTKLGVTATTRNWRTVTTLLEMADNG